MPDQVTEFETQRAQASIAVDDLVDEHRDEFKTRYLELLNEPAKRIDGILNNLLLELYESDGEETGNWPEAEQYWESAGDVAVESFTGIHMVPVKDRGSAFSDGRRLMSRWAFDQAFTEIFGEDLIRLSVDSGEEITRMAAGMTRAQLADLSDGNIDIKAAKVRIKEGQTNGVSS
jgi:hypothetical protein